MKGKGEHMEEQLYWLMNWPLIEGIEYTDIDNPAELLGQKVTEHGILIQGFFPDATKVEVKHGNKRYEMKCMDEFGYYAVLVNGKRPISYKYVITYGDTVVERYDAYAYKPVYDMKELKKFNAGISYEAYRYMGAHPMTIDGVSGVQFLVWAPFALRVSVVGDFNNWDGRAHQMSRIEDTGIFGIFVPEVKPGAIYKYEIKKKGGANLLKCDPYAFATERGGEACIVTDAIEENAYQWKDETWMKNRVNQNVTAMPLNIYEIFLGNFTKDGEFKYEQAAKTVAAYAKKMKYTHVQLMPIAEYQNDASLGYETTNFFAPSARYGSEKGLMAFVDALHGQGIGVILDITPYQFASGDSGMRAFDGSCLYEHMDPKRGIHPKTRTYMFNYARPEVTNLLITNAFMWMQKYHVDGFKIAKLASMLYLDYERKPGEWLPNIYGGKENLEAIEFLKHFNSIIHKQNTGIVLIAEDNSGYPRITGEVGEDCLGFDFKWNEAWRKDFLKYLALPPYLRGNRYNDLSLSMVYQYSDNFILGYPDVEFIGGQPSLIGKMTGDTEARKFANLRLALSYAMVHPGKKMLFAGQELAAYENWNADDTFNGDLKDAEQQKQIQECVKKLNEMYISEPALYELDQDSDGFEWINNISANESILTFVRKGVKEEDLLLVVCNFEDIDHTDYKIGVPLRGKYKEIFNSANASFGGNGFVNARLKQSKTDECDGREESVRVNVAGLSVAVFKYSKAEEKVAGNEAAKENVAKKTSKVAETKKETVPAKPKKTTAKKAAETVTKTATTAKKKVTETAADAKKKVTETATDAKKKVSETVADVKKKATDTKKKETETASDEKKKATKSTKKAADKTTTKSE